MCKFVSIQGLYNIEVQSTHARIDRLPSISAIGDDVLRLDLV